MKVIKLVRIFPSGARAPVYLRAEDFFGIAIQPVPMPQGGAMLHTSIIAARGGAFFDCVVEETADVILTKLGAEIIGETLT